SGGADCIQLRVKEMPDDALSSVASEFVKICVENGVCSVINDRADIAIACDADGVHLGQNDLPVQSARRLAQKPMIIGKSTHSMEQLKNACEEQPTYVSLGPVFSTGTKPSAQPVGLEYVRNGTAFLKEEAIGHAAIGGITEENIAQVLEAGASCIAVSKAVIEAADPAAACRSLRQKITAYKDKFRT
ncbi:MAG: thiamine phosphate synthase, partial [Sedimentisphaerales bacterium]